MVHHHHTNVTALSHIRSQHCLEESLALHRAQPQPRVHNIHSVQPIGHNSRPQRLLQCAGHPGPHQGGQAGRLQRHASQGVAGVDISEEAEGGGAHRGGDCPGQGQQMHQQGLIRVPGVLAVARGGNTSVQDSQGVSPGHRGGVGTVDLSPVQRHPHQQAGGVGDGLHDGGELLLEALGPHQHHAEHTQHHLVRRLRILPRDIQGGRNSPAHTGGHRGLLPTGGVRPECPGGRPQLGGTRHQCHTVLSAKISRCGVHQGRSAPERPGHPRPRGVVMDKRQGGPGGRPSLPAALQDFHEAGGSSGGFAPVLRFRCQQCESPNRAARRHNLR
mmetsp:Transcript_59780/g.138194  ORF Transcript_59780/g.138194 Transcript_59780/m.138194 type:complete len:330 (-) Transcript_59780:5240-6229(-)